MNNYDSIEEALADVAQTYGEKRGNDPLTASRTALTTLTILGDGGTKTDVQEAVEKSKSHVNGVFDKLTDYGFVEKAGDRTYHVDPEAYEAAKEADPQDLTASVSKDDAFYQWAADTFFSEEDQAEHVMYERKEDIGRIDDGQSDDLDEQRQEIESDWAGYDHDLPNGV